MREIVFHLADAAMEDAFRAFFRREDWHFALGCRRFDIDPYSARDIYRIAGSNSDLNPCRNDPGIWNHAHDNLQSHLKTHERAVIVLDEFFGGSTGAESLTETITQNLCNSGWAVENVSVIVIRPMLEAWLWADNPNVAQAFGFSDFRSLQEPLIERNLWDRGAPKPLPDKMKEAKKVALKLGQHKKLPSSPFVSVFRSISSRAFDICQEPGFQQMRQTLQAWFPQEGGMA